MVAKRRREVIGQLLSFDSVPLSAMMVLCPFSDLESFSWNAASFTCERSCCSPALMRPILFPSVCTADFLCGPPEGLWDPGFLMVADFPPQPRTHHRRLARPTILRRELKHANRV
ncbi:hypothetical protein, unlikely [Trypanosoma brucei gambiense DAL972]|uniref:Uncharacterized protein n=1 Tax=Trypanosoma brucei gambiense (strain MHOM/CI/86/DAL972) TaxID=679716 RepID=C9ZX50_TRYB9|nr:hypothetical protein, unlikely [Trypanosoma brucei gambiense DAL972]CBH13992.1 hypothetical protein, unlikely [Trypanosoma brucei gambiense DAL972]|eukprot:XP_011776265.1 hypothetical protein, unlikely [Trypanosoma brucei gambiense DAL972]